MSASETRGEYGGMGAPPVTAVQLPLPPLCTFLMSTSFGAPFSTVPSVSVALISFWPLYFSATSFHAGPTTILSTEWQARQPLFFANSRPTSDRAAVLMVVAASWVMLWVIANFIMLCSFYDLAPGLCRRASYDAQLLFRPGPART